MLDDSVLIARAERLRAEGFACAAAELWFELAFHREKTDAATARDALTRALTLALRGDDPRLLAEVSELFARIEADEQNLQKATELHLAASFFWQQTGDFDAWAMNQYNLGVLLLWMGRFDEAETLLENLLRSSDSIERGKRTVVAAALTILGRTYIVKGDFVAAEKVLEQARVTRRDTDSRGMAATLDALCSLRMRQGDFDRAAVLNREVRRLVAGELRSEANALASSAEIALGLGRLTEALALAGQARSLIRKAAAEDPNLDLHILFIEAGAERALGRHRRADAHMEAFLARAEAYRQVGQSALIMSFFAARRQYLSAWIDDLVSSGRIAEAFDVTEWTRARTLLDSLVWSGAEIRQRVSPELRAQDRKLRAELASLGTQLETLQPDDERKAEQLASRARSLRLSLMSLDAAMRSQAGTPTALPLGFGEARKLVDDGTLVLCYWLGENSSLIWAITSDEAVVIPGLPAREPIERSAQRLRHLLTRGKSADPEARNEMRALSEVLLRPVLQKLKTTRSVIVIPDGALAQIPFAVLPQPQEDDTLGPPLVETVPLTMVHSLSVLAAIRARAETRYRQQTLTFVAVADPVYHPADPRLPSSATSTSPPSGVFWRRLAGSGREARSITRLLPADDSRLLLGLDASRERVLEGCLEGSRFVHFGVHADLHWNNPELSAMYLSAFDSSGHAVDGALRLQDLERLQLAADLVVLAGCRTGLGRSYLGEGPLALPRGFLSAGAAAVVATLWQVDDRATALLVERLWKGILDEGLPPDLALQRAQLELAHSVHWQRPIHWAGFVLLGDPAS